MTTSRYALLLVDGRQICRSCGTDATANVPRVFRVEATIEPGRPFARLIDGRAVCRSCGVEAGIGDGRSFVYLGGRRLACRKCGVRATIEDGCVRLVHRRACSVASKMLATERARVPYWLSCGDIVVRMFSAVERAAL
jgi:hypothetical protein